MITAGFILIVLLFSLISRRLERTLDYGADSFHRGWAADLPTAAATDHLGA